AVDPCRVTSVGVETVPACVPVPAAVPSRAAGCGIARLPCCPPRPWVVPARPEDALTDARMTPVPGPRVTCPMLDRPDPEYVPPSVSVAFDVRADPSALYAGFTTTHPFVYCRASAADWLPAAPS